jgi:hypothetical protein
MPAISLSVKDAKLYSWIVHEAEQREVKVSELICDILNAQYQGKLVDAESPDELRKKGDELIEKGKRLGMKAVEVEIEKEKQLKRAADEAVRVLNFNMQVSNWNPEQLQDKANEWFNSLDGEQKEAVRGHLKTGKLSEVFCRFMRGTEKF